MRHLKRPALLGLLLLACLLLAGCRMDSTMEELFTLPRLPTEYTTPLPPAGSAAVGGL